MKLVGPKLRYVETRLEEEQGLGRDWINAWIKNNAGLIKSGDADAKEAASF